MLIVNTSQKICNNLIKSGLGFWDYDTVNCTFQISDSFRYLLGFEHEIISLNEAVSLIPEEFRSSINIQQRQVQAHPASSVIKFPIVARGGWIWIQMQSLSEYLDEFGNKHHSGIIQQFSSDETNSFEYKSGISSNVVIQLAILCHKVVSNDSFFDALHQYIIGMHTALPKVSIAVAKWCGNDVFELIDYVGVTIYDVYSFQISKSKKFNSRWLQCICETHRACCVNTISLLGDEWSNDRESFKNNHLQSTFQQPIITNDGEVWGLLSISRKQQTHWDEFDIQCIYLISNMISLMALQYRKTNQKIEQEAINNMICKMSNIYRWSWKCENYNENIENTTITVINEKGETQEYSGLNVRNNIHKNDINKFYTSLQLLLSKRSKKIVLRVRLKISNEEYHWCDIEGTVVKYNSASIPVLVVGVIHDVDSEVKQVLKTKRETQFQNTIYESIPVGIEFFNVQGELCYANERLAQILGLEGSVKSIYGINLFNDPMFTAEQRNQIKRQHTSDFFFEYDFSKSNEFYKSKNKRPIEINIRFSKLYANGKQTGYLGVVVDNTIKKANERKIATLENFFAEIGKFALVGICWFHDKEGFVSAQWNSNLGRAEKDNDFDSYDKIIEEDRISLKEHINRLSSGEISSLQKEVRVIFDDGKMHWIRIHLINNSSFGYKGIIGLSMDITQQKENEQMLIDARKKAESMDSMKSQFIANVSHEIRTPLNAIIGFSDILLQSPPDDPDKAIYADIIHTNNDILLKLISDILDLSKIESGNISFQYKIENVNMLCKEIFLSLESKVPHNVKFVYLPRTDDDDTEIYCDKARVVQILTNFITNAFKFTTQGRILLSYEVSDGQIIFNVSDTGKGIPKESQSYIFDAFVKLDKFTVGTGLGLSICRNLAKQMGGSIGVESAVEKGSHFWLSLPYITSEDICAIKDEKGNIVDVSSYLEYRKNVIIIEDKPDRLSFLTYSLDKYNIITAPSNGFLFYWLGKKTLLTIVDVDSCYGTALFIISSIRQRGAIYKIIVINDVNSGVSDEQLYDAGANDIVYLPMDGKEFKDILHRNVSIN